MEKFLGHEVKFWIKIRAVLRHARIETPDDLAAALGVKLSLSMEDRVQRLERAVAELNPGLDWS